MRALVAKPVQAFEQQPGREDDLHRESDFRLPASRELARGALESACLVDQSTCAAVEQPAGRRENRLAPLDFECLHAEQRFELLHRVSHGGLALMQGFCCLCVTAVIHHGKQGASMLQADVQGVFHR